MYWYNSHLLLVTIVIAEDIPDISQSTLPEVYLPEECDIVHLNGFNQAIIISQRSDRYPANYLCKVLINLHGDYHIHFTFEKLDLAEPNSDGRCPDSVQIFNRVGQTNVPLTERICGSRRPNTPLLTNSSSAMLVFSTDSYQERTGFRIKYDRVLSNSQPRETGAASGCIPGRCTVSSASSNRLDRSFQHSTVVLLLVSLVSSVVYLYSVR